MSLDKHFKLDPNSPSYVAWARDGAGPTASFREGDPVVGQHSRGYYSTCFGGRTYLMHRVVYELTHGYCPAVIDHIDTNKRNNHPDNLRAAAPNTNQWNHAQQINNTSGIKGLSKHLQSGGWVGQIKKNKKCYSKYSNDKAVVIEWLIATRKELHKEYANHG